MRILHVLQSLEVGGAELVALELARAQRHRGNDVSLLVLRCEGGALGSRVTAAGLDVRLARGRPRGLDFGLYGRVRRVLAEVKPEVVHTHDPGSLLYGAPVARSHGAVVVHTKHGHDTEGTRRLLAARRAGACVHALVTVSADVATIARRGREVRETKLCVIENGVDTDRFTPGALATRRGSARQRLGLPAESVVVGCVARIEAIKRHSLLLDALLPTLNEDRHLLVVGDGSLRPAIEAQASQHPGGRFVKLSGMVDDPLEALAAMDVFALASSHEGLPLALLEALSCGLPVVASSVGGIPKVIEHGVSGWLVELGDPGNAQVLRAALDNVAADAVLRREVGESARQRVIARYSLTKTSDEYLELYRGLARRHSARNRPRGRRVARVAKLRHRSLAELRVRARQRIRRYTEQLPWWHPPSPDVAPRLRRRDEFGSGRPMLPPLHDNWGEVRTRSWERWPDQSRVLVERAERVIAGRFDLLGYSGLSFGDPIDWHRDPVSGRRAPFRHWSRIDFLDERLVGDHKVTWELNRHQHLITLAQAYRLTGDPRFAQAVGSQLKDWSEANPPKIGVNWASSLEVALRAIAWIWTLRMLEGTPLPPETVALLERLLYLHGDHLEGHLSTCFSPNTHLTGEALCLVYLGVWLDAGSRAERWRSLGWRILNEQIERQVLDDGVYFEQSTWYQRYTADFYLHALLLGAAQARPEAPGLRAKVSRLCELLMVLTRADGTTPLLGDDDGGRLLPLDFPVAGDSRSTLALAAVVFGRGDFKSVAGPAPASLLWLLGVAGIGRYDALPARPPAPASRAFPVGGYYVLRDGWSGQASMMAVKAGPFCALSGGHGHADALAFDLTVAGRPMLVDVGTGAYVGELRDRCRVSQAHNTLCLDGRSTAEPAGPFSWKTLVTGQALSWEAGREFTFFSGSHDGYRHVAGIFSVQRTILHVVGEYWLVLDQVEACGAHDFDLRFHTASNVCVRRLPAAAAELTCGEARLLLLTEGHDGVLEFEPNWVSPCYGNVQPSVVIRYRGRAESDFAVLTALVPGAATSSLRLEGGARRGGWAWTLSSPSHRDTLLLAGRGGSVHHEAASIQEGVFWLRRNRDGKPERCVLPHSGPAKVDGFSLSRSGSPSSIVGAWRPDRFEWEV